MATVDKNFRVKNGLVVEGTTGTINGEDIITADKITGGTQTNISVTYTDGNVNFVAENGNFTAGTGIDITDDEISVDRTTTDTWYDAAGSAATAESNAESYADDLVGDPTVDGTAGNTVTDRIATAAAGALSDAEDYADGLASNYDPAGSASTAESNANSYTDDLIGDLTVDGTSGNTVTDRIATALSDAEDYADGLASNYEAAGAVSTHSDLTTGVHGVSGDVVGTSDAQTLTNKTMGDDLLMDGNQVSGLGTPTQSDHAATKGYVDTAVSGLNWKDSVNLLVDSNINVSGDFVGLEIDGHAALDTDDAGYRLLLTGQTTDSENGIYELYVDGSTLLAQRTDDADTYQELIDATVLVIEGTQYAGSSWVQSNHYLTDFTSQDWVQFGGTSLYTAGNGLTLTGNEFAIDASITATKTFATGEVTTHAALTTTHGVSGAIVGTSDEQTLTNKTIDASSNTLSNIGNASLTNSAITINGTSTSLGGSITLDADDISDASTTNKFFTDELAVDAVAAAIAAGTQTNITITYDDEAGSLSFNSAGASIIDTDVSFTSVEVNSVSKQVAATQTVTTAGQVVAHSFAHADFTSAEYFVKVTDGTDSEVSKVLITLDSSNNIAITEYGNVQSNGSLSSITAGINGTDVELLVTTTENNSDVIVSGTLLI